jgi:hypothetical protein
MTADGRTPPPIQPAVNLNWSLPAVNPQTPEALRLDSSPSDRQERVTPGRPLVRPITIEYLKNDS